jgi:S1-C subfamily serine protease
MSENTILKLDVWKRRWGSLRAWGKRVLPFVSGVLAALIAFFLYDHFLINPNQLTQQDVSTSIASVLASATPPPSYSSQVYQVIQPSLILVQTEFPGKSGKKEFGLGSGVVVDFAGDILTSLHVVDGATDIRVTFADGTQSSASVVFSMPEKDIAVLQALDPPLELYPATLGNPGALDVGDEAFVIGNPFGLYGSMSSGVVSGFNRTFDVPESDRQLQGLIQIDAAVNPGNSGGPLLNRDGHVVGIVTGIVNPMDEGFFVGIGFAVPIDVAVGGMGTPPY